MSLAESGNPVCEAWEAKIMFLPALRNVEKIVRRLRDHHNGDPIDHGTLESASMVPLTYVNLASAGAARRVTHRAPPAQIQVNPAARVRRCGR